MKLKSSQDKYIKQREIIISSNTQFENNALSTSTQKHITLKKEKCLCQLIQIKTYLIINFFIFICLLASQTR